MHDIEPYYNWRHLYTAEEDPQSPFYEREYSEFEYSQTVYNFYIHPQWDDFGSRTLFCKILFADYEQGFAIIEFMGEWNDAIENDIYTFRRNIADVLSYNGIYKFILLGESVMNFHSSDDLYYEDWLENLKEEGGWVVFINLTEQSKYDFVHTGITNYIELIELPQWRTFQPEHLFNLIDNAMLKRLM